MFGAKAATCHGQKQGFKASTCHRTNYFQIGDIIQDSGSICCFNDLNIRVYWETMEINLLSATTI